MLVILPLAIISLDLPSLHEAIRELQRSMPVSLYRVRTAAQLVVGGALPPTAEGFNKAIVKAGLPDVLSTKAKALAAALLCEGGAVPSYVEAAAVVGLAGLDDPLIAQAAGMLASEFVHQAHGYGNFGGCRVAAAKCGISYNGPSDLVIVATAFQLVALRRFPTFDIAAYALGISMRDYAVLRANL